MRLERGNIICQRAQKLHENKEKIQLVFVARLNYCSFSSFINYASFYGRALFIVGGETGRIKIPASALLFLLLQRGEQIAQLFSSLNKRHKKPTHCFLYFSALPGANAWCLKCGCAFYMC
jgi:hypothetical protein